MTDRWSPGGKPCPFQPFKPYSSVHRIGFLIPVCLVLFVRWHVWYPKGTSQGAKCKEQPEVAGNLSRYLSGFVLTIVVLPRPLSVSRGAPSYLQFLCLKGVLWPGREMKFLEVSSPALLAFVKPWIDKDVFLVSLIQRMDGSLSSGQQKRRGGFSPHQEEGGCVEFLEK